MCLVHTGETQRQVIRSLGKVAGPFVASISFFNLV